MSSSPIEWFRHTGPYMRSHRGKTFVIHLGSGALDSPQFGNLCHDLALLQSLGVRIVLVHGTRGDIETALANAGVPSHLHQGIRVTDSATLQVVRDVVSRHRLRIERRLSMGLPDSPMRGARLRVISGNFLTARPLGIVDGVDFQFTGAVRRIDAPGISAALDSEAIVLLSPMGFSSTGEVFNLSADEVATAAAIAMGADKLIILDEHDGLMGSDGTLLRQCTIVEAQALTVASEGQALHRDAACRACEHGVPRVHLLNFNHNGVLLEELFTHDGAGTLVSRDNFERARPATVDDIAGVLDLVRPLEQSGVLVRRSREKLEQEIANFRVLERDGRIIACAALYTYPDEAVAELACIAIDGAYRGEGRGEYLISLLEDEARQLGLAGLFVLTTQTSHWFQERGFKEQGLDALPAARQELYNLQRNSRVLIRAL